MKNLNRKFGVASSLEFTGILFGTQKKKLGDLLGKVLGILARAVFRSLRRRARDYGIPRGQCGAVTFIQRFGSALNLTPHLHMLTLDGVYAAKDGEAPRFYPLRAMGRVGSPYWTELD